ncbi:unnamed protein product [Euphydryas editha]|uniref:Endonuclease/exonuclease/phosphatase domain-containing protein n=1 Tax=Euphydryas editha TaxID=104508 RepID=A0AAU9UL28_EUPED|nr:unnamed protein product [Euphydryas editha]
MEGQFKLLFDQMKIEMDKQTNIIFKKMDEKLEPLIKENETLKNRIELLEKKIEYFEKEKRKNNILFFGLDEKEDSSVELFEKVQDIFKQDLKITIEANDISKIHRIGITKENKIRPVLISFANNWKRNMILKLKKSLKDLYYITEDFPKEVLEKRRELKSKLIEERAKGNIAYIKYDQLVVKEGNLIQEKRKRDQSTSPATQNQAKKPVTSNALIKENRRNAFDLLYNPNPAGPRGVERPPPQKRNNNKVYIATLNVRTLRLDYRLEELEEAITPIKWDVIGLCEVRRIGEEIREYNEYIFYFYGKTQGMYGMGFLVKKHLKDKIVSFQGISDRIAVVNIQLTGPKQPWSIIQVHAPREQDKKLAKEKFYNDLTELMQKINKNVIVMGDLNAKVGKKSNKDEFILGDYSTGDRNDNGQRLIDFCFAHNLKIMNSFFKKRKSRKWTWLAPNGRDKNEIDFILAKEKDVFTDIDVINKLNFNTDHRMVRGAITNTNNNLRKHIIHSTNNKTTTTSIPKNILSDLRNKLQETDEIKSTQEKYNFLEKELINLIKSSSKKEKTNKLGEETLKLMETRNGMLGNRRDNKQKIASISKKIHESIRKHKKEERLRVLREQIEKTGGINKGLKQLKEYTQWIPNIKTKSKKNKNEKLTAKRLSIVKVATEFFKKLYTETDSTLPAEEEKEIHEEEIPCILESEVIKAIQSQKSDWEHLGININGSNLNHLRFADDIVLFAEKPSILQTMLQQLDRESEKAGLSMNPMKTKDKLSQ